MTRSKLQAPPSLTQERARRLFRFVKMTEGTPRSRDTLMKKLKLDLRGFYRDLSFLRELGILFKADQEKYQLDMNWNQARALLPFPVPILSFEEVEALSRGSTAAHRKLKQLFDSYTLEKGTSGNRN
jgi:hypothetical protein